MFIGNLGIYRPVNSVHIEYDMHTKEEKVCSSVMCTYPPVNKLHSRIPFSLSMVEGPRILSQIVSFDVWLSRNSPHWGRQETHFIAFPVHVTASGCKAKSRSVHKENSFPSLLCDQKGRRLCCLKLSGILLEPTRIQRFFSVSNERFVGRNGSPGTCGLCGPGDDLHRRCSCKQCLATL